MAKLSIREHVLVFLKDKGDVWTWGGIIEDYLRTVHGAKGSTTSRVLRDLSESGERSRLLKDYESINGVQAVKYKYNFAEHERLLEERRKKVLMSI
jgi:hypothetical protein